MSLADIPVPRLTTANASPLQHIEEVVLNHVADIEKWFREGFEKTPAPITSSVDLRNASFKLAPVDTNLFPAGFNNLNKDFIPLCVQAVQSVLLDGRSGSECTEVLLIPESHTRNTFYLQSLSRLRDIFVKAGFVVRIGSIDETIKEPREFFLDGGEVLIVEPIEYKNGRIQLHDFEPSLVLLNNDLSAGIPEKLVGLKQQIHPPVELGWGSRLKSSHFQYFEQVVTEFSQLIDIDPWLINPLFKRINDIDFMAKEGIAQLADAVEELLLAIGKKYNAMGITERPFVVVKADNGTYGMGVMMVHDKAEILNLNRKQRTRMSASKSSRKVSKVIVQEGVPSFETVASGAVAEPVVYMIGQYVVGGFYRVHQGRGKYENLNAPGMHFEPLAFAEACNVPCEAGRAVDVANRFYVYGVVARLAALAAAREIAANGGNK